MDEALYRIRRNPTSSELVELLTSLQKDNILITYHGTTVEQAVSILKEGFKQPNLFGILMDAYRLTGMTREVRRTLPFWTREYITHDLVSRLAGEGYHHVSFAPHGVASRWSGWGGEVLHELVREINVIKAFMASDFPKTEEGFDAWDETVNIASFYQNLGEPIVLKAWIQLDPPKADRIIKEILRLLNDFPPEIAWEIWNYTYRDDRLSDLSRVLKIEVAAPPKIRP